MRYLPDVSFTSAEDMVDAATNGRALIRVLNSRSDAEDLGKLFRRADPPVRVEVYDSKTDEIIS
jgi:hypothetical protein